MGSMSSGKTRISPLAKVKSDYEHESSTYPETIRVAMEDGSVQRYQLITDQPHPCFAAAMSILRRWPVGSYQYPYGRKKDRGL